MSSGPEETRLARLRYALVSAAENNVTAVIQAIGGTGELQSLILSVRGRRIRVVHARVPKDGCESVRRGHPRATASPLSRETPREERGSSG
jgi:hypothetical protein